MAEMGADFELTPPEPAPAPRKRVRASGEYNASDHQWLLNLVARHLTLRVYLRLNSRRHMFKDWAEMATATVMYFAHVELGWPQIQTAGRFGRHRESMRYLIHRIEDLRESGDVFDIIEQRIRHRDLL